TEKSPPQPGGPQPAPDDALAELSPQDAARLSAALRSLYGGEPGATSGGARAELDVRVLEMIARQTSETGTSGGPALRLVGDQPTPERMTGGALAAGRQRGLRVPRWLAPVAGLAAVIAITAMLIPWSGSSSQGPGGLGGSRVSKATPERANSSDRAGAPAIEGGSTGGDERAATAEGSGGPATMTGLAPAGFGGLADAAAGAWSSLDDSSAVASLRSEIDAGKADIVTAQRLGVLLSRGVSIDRSMVAVKVRDADGNLREYGQVPDKRPASAGGAGGDANLATREQVRDLAMQAVRLSVPVDSRGARADEPLFWMTDDELGEACEPVTLPTDPSPEGDLRAVNVVTLVGGVRWRSETAR
ncbi:MAG: hypothetical protein K2X32_00310, partial [Phycisphaerales bacterium]|nr:hypothetical protein [Phycisphaerales bacterium]